MRPIPHKRTTPITQPFVTIVAFAAATSQPLFAMTNYGLGQLDADTIKYVGDRIPILANVENLKCTEVLPNALGSGLVRKEASFSVKSNGPYTNSVISAKLYSCGATIDSSFYAIWVTDFANSYDDIAGGTCMGYYKLDVGLNWDENSINTELRLIELLLSQTGRYSDGNDAAEEVLAGSEFQALLDQPAYLGAKYAVKAIGRAAAKIAGFETYNKAVKGVIAGLVQSSVLEGTSIVLGKSPALAAIVGTTVKLKMGNGCLIQGVITALTDSNYGINTTGLLLNQAWTSVTVHNKGYTAVTGPVATSKTDLGVVFLSSGEALTKLPSPTMYLKTPGTVSMYDSGPVTTATALYLKLTGISDEANKALSCEPLKDPAHKTRPYTGINVLFNVAQQNTYYTDAANVHLNYATWLAPQTCNAYFTNKTYVLADIQKEGMPWELIITETVNNTVPLNINFYIKLIGDTHIGESAAGQYAIYADSGKELVPVPNAEISAIDYNCAEFGLPDLCRITLKRKLSEIDESWSDDELYVDTLPIIQAASCLAYCMDRAGIPYAIRGPTLKLEGYIKTGNPMALSIGNETWSELIDSIAFESGLKLECGYGVYTTRKAFNNANVLTWNSGTPTATYFRVTTEKQILYNDVVNGTVAMRMGQMLTSITSDGLEYVRTYYKYSYVASEYGGQKLRELVSAKSKKANDREIIYQFKHLNDSPTVAAAAIQMSKIGHIANIPATTRMVTIGLPFDYITMQASDTVQLVNFRHLTALSDPLPQYSDTAGNASYTYNNGDVYGKYTKDVPYVLLPGIGVIESITYDFSGDTGTAPITAVFKQVQQGTSCNLRNVATAITMPDEATNDNNSATTSNTASGSGSGGGGMEYTCPPDQSLQSVVIVPGKLSSMESTTQDPCCNSSTEKVDVWSDTVTYVTCSGNGWDSDNDLCPQGFGGASIIWDTVPGYDSTINSSIPAKFRIRGATASTGCPTLVRISYEGMDPATSSNCVSFVSSGCQAPDYDIGVLTVYPCVFNVPKDSYTKTITLVFSDTYCSVRLKPLPKNANGTTDWDTYNDWKRTGTAWEAYYTTTEKSVTVTVSLQPVSDISIS